MLDAHPTISILVGVVDPFQVSEYPYCRNQGLAVGREHKGGSVWCGISRDGDAGPLLGCGNVPHRELGMPYFPIVFFLICTFRQNHRSGDQFQQALTEAADFSRDAARGTLTS